MDRLGPQPRGAPLNASAADQQRLLELQGRDSRLAQLAHRRSHLPEEGELAEIATELQRADGELVDLQTQRSDIAREAGKLERDIEQVRARAQRDQERLDSGAIGSAKELESLQHEIASLQRRQGDLEDAELEILQQVEDLDHAVTALESRRAELLMRQAETTQRRDEELARIGEEEAEVAVERDALAAQVPADLLAFYDKLRGQLGGVAVAALKQRRCDGCRLELNAIEVGQFRDAPEDAVLRCEECRRIVVRTAESGL